MIMKIRGAASHIKHYKTKIVLVAALILCCTATTVFAAASSMTTYVYCEGEMKKVVSFSENPEYIVAKAEIELGENDRLNLDSYSSEADESVIYVYKAHSVTVKDGDGSTTVLVSGTVADALKEAGVKLKKGDKTNVSTQLLVSDDMTVEVQRCFGISFTCDGETTTHKVTKGTVEDLLKKTGTKLGENDLLSCKVNAPLKDGMKVKVTRVTYKKRTEFKDVDFKSVTVQSSAIYEGEQQVTTKGVKGQDKLIYTDEYRDGKLYNSKLDSRTTVKEPVVEILSKGTKQRPVPATKPAVKTTTAPKKKQAVKSTTVTNVKPAKTGNAVSVLTPPSSLKLDKNGRPVNYKKVYVGDATAYSIGSKTASGMSTCPGRVAVNPKLFPYGTKLYIVTSNGSYVYGYSVAADTGGFVHNGSGVLVDLFMDSYAQACRFGRREVEVYVL